MRKFWERLRGAQPAAPGLDPRPQTRRTHLRDVTAALPAAAAVDRMRRALADLALDARLVWLSAGERITAKGLSDLWEARWLLPTARAVVTVDVGIDPHAATDETWAERFMVVRLVPDLAADPELSAALEAGEIPARLKNTPLGAVMTGLLEHGQLPPDWLEQQWAAELQRQAELPRMFHDSPAAVAALAAQGVDFLAGDSHTFLEATTLPGLGAVWRTRARDVEYHTPFGRAAD